jgi:IMP dehydrogenase/GMP reductase
MASSHKLKNPNGDPFLSSQEKSIDIRVNQGIDSPSNETLPVDYNHNKSEIPKEYINMTQPAETIADKLIGVKPFEFPVVSNSVKLDFNDILIQPKAQTNIFSRKQVNPYYVDDFGKYKLPLFTAPMDTVVAHDNMREFIVNKINVVLPRTENKKGLVSNAFNSFGLNDNPVINEDCKFVLLDVANGHMSNILEWCNNLKKKYPYVKIMAGNIANPHTYKIYCDSGVIDYARIGIGNGNGCLTTQHTGIGYPMASLIIECNEIKQKHNNKVKIVADGGMKEYRDIITALALGADYVMVGSIFSKAIESSGQKYWKGIKIKDKFALSLYLNGFNITKEFRGMSTKEAQKALGNKVIKTSEGVVRKYKVEYRLSKWVENFEDYLRSNMSYCNANTLDNFIGRVDYNLISTNALNRFNK